MSENIAFGLAVTVAACLIYGLKHRTYRKWLGILFATVGAISAFTLIARPGEFDPGNVFLVMWITGLALFFERDKYHEAD